MFLKVYIVEDKENMRVGTNNRMLEVGKAVDKYQPMKAEDLW